MADALGRVARRAFGRGRGRYATTAHVLVSAVLKLMRVLRIPPGLALYRGLGGEVALPASFEAADANGLYGYAEWGFLSTTSSKDVAVQVQTAGAAALLREMRVQSPCLSPCVQSP